MELNKIYNMDCMEGLRRLPDKSIDMVLADPPYNIGKAAWDNIQDYINWCLSWIKECERVLTDTGSLYIWHNDMGQIPALMEAVNSDTGLSFRQFNIWVKKNFRGLAWKHPTEKNTLRNWFNICEYCLYYVKPSRDGTSLEGINSNPECYKPLKEWYAAEKSRLGLTDRDIGERYTQATGKKPYMLRHYFKDNQFEIPTRAVWESVYEPLGFEKNYKGLAAELEELRAGYEGLKDYYESLRPVHTLDAGHCNVWQSRLITGSESTGKNHICEKPVDILERIIRTSTREDATVCDPFIGSGSVAIAALKSGRRFIGFENDEGTFQKAQERIDGCVCLLIRIKQLSSFL